MRSSPVLATDLGALEAAARLGSFTRAAEELGMSQPAISQQVKRLERRLRTALFVRRGRGVSLTADGLQLCLEVRSARERIDAAIAALERRGGSSNLVTLAVSNGFASLWLLPKLSLLREACPAVELNIRTTERPEDYAAEQMQLVVRRGDGYWPGQECWKLAEEIIYPVCSPRYLATRAPIAEPADLTRHRLIHVHDNIFRHVVWTDWFKAMNVPESEMSTGFEFNDYALSIRAAVAGEGVALGWDYLVGDLIAQGELAAPVPLPLSTGQAHWLITPRAAALTPAMARVRDWLIAASARPQPRVPVAIDKTAARRRRRHGR
jgi:DNA-binding transcriptional LysR family regulator